MAANIDGECAQVLKKTGCGVRGAGCGVREGVPLMRHEYIWGMCTGGVEKLVVQEGIGNWGLGIRKGVAADAATSIYGECRQAGMKSSYKSKRSRLPRLGELSASD